MGFVLVSLFAVFGGVRAPLLAGSPRADAKPALRGSSVLWRFVWEFRRWAVFFVCRFVFAVSPSGVCSFVSRRSGRRLSGGAVSACARAVVRAVRVPFSGVLVSPSAFRAAWRWLRSPRPVPSLRFPPVPAFSSRSGVLGLSWRAFWVFARGSLVPPRAPSVPPSFFPPAGPAPAPAPAPLGSFAWFSGVSPVEGLSGASACGSAAFLVSPSFRSAVAGGACPVSLSLSSFAWPLRSAVLWSLVVVCSRPAGFAFLASPACVSASRLFLRRALSALGFSVSGRCWGSPSASERACAFLARRSVPLPRPFSSLRGVASSSAVVSALGALSRCLFWLSRRSSAPVFCPGALRPALASLASLVLGSLWEARSLRG